MKRKDFYLFLLTGIFLVVLINFRNLFTDELKYYLPAALMMREGLIPYRDFFFPQMPLSAIFFIPTSTGGWSGLFLTRTLASILFLLIGYLFLKRGILSREINGQESNRPSSLVSGSL